LAGLFRREVVSLGSVEHPRAEFEAGFTDLQPASAGSARACLLSDGRVTVRPPAGGRRLGGGARGRRERVRGVR
ncbi:hypothetical protein AB0D08_40090, partial [Kitasatospora sp. NPDC048540]